MTSESDLVKQAQKFLARKGIAEFLARKTLTNDHIIRLNRLFSEKTCKELENVHLTIAKFVYYDLTNYKGRLRRLIGRPGTTKYTQLLRYGKVAYREIYHQQSNNRVKHFTNRIEYWTSRGLTIDDAKLKVSECQTDRSRRSPVSKKGVTTYSVRCVDYWMKLGYSESEAKLKVSHVQARKRTPESISQWLATLDSKTESEKKLINLKKGHSPESFKAKGFDDAESLRLSNLYYSKRQNYSHNSQIFFSLLDTVIGSSNTFFKIKNYEKQFYGKCVDYYDQDSGTVVEFYGDFWHRNPKKYNSEFIAYGLTSDQIWKRDFGRLNMIRQHPEVTLVLGVWESEVQANSQALADDIKRKIIENGTN